MSRTLEILFMTEYIKNALYFATVRQGKILMHTADTHYFSIDDELIYENYYSDFGPLNLGCVYKYCKILNEKLKLYLNKQCIVHYTSIDPKKKANSAFLLGCYGVLYLSLQPKDALKPLLTHGQSYRPFQDATQGDSTYTISLLDCLQGFAKARDLHFFNFQDFNYDEYDRLDKIQGGDLNWIVPAFIGPVDYSVSLYHPPEMYIDYFQNNNVKIVIRLNKRLYDGNVFVDAGITHYDLFFPDGSCPPRHILLKFLQISEESQGTVAVHCKAGLGRTGSLIGCYLIKHYRMTAHEAIAWMRICRPGSVIGHQQGWLEELEPWLIKQGNLYRKRYCHDIDKIPSHEFGIYSIAEKTLKQRPVVYSKSQSPSPPTQRKTRSYISPVARPQASKIREDNFENDEEEVFITACDLTIQPTEPITHMKGCVIKNSTVTEEYFNRDTETNLPLWKKYLCCKACVEALYDKLWMLAVRCAKIAPAKCYANKCCILLDLAGPVKTTQNRQFECNERMNSGHTAHTRVSREINASGLRGSGAGEPRILRISSRSNSAKLQGKTDNKINEFNDKSLGGYFHVPKYHTSQTPISAKPLSNVQNILMRGTLNDLKSHLNSSIIVKPQHSFRDTNAFNERPVPGNITQLTSTKFNTASKGLTQSQQRRRLGRSPSPPSTRIVAEQSRATNTPPSVEVINIRDSRSNLRDALSRLKLSAPRNGSVGAASLGARRDAPADRRATSVRSDERPIATQGDMLNSIKLQRRFRDNITAERYGSRFNDKTYLSTTSKAKSNTKNVTMKTNNSTGPKILISQEHREKTLARPSRVFNSPRPSSPKGRRSPHPSFY